jgi:hypothetical protein
MILRRAIYKRSERFKKKENDSYNLADSLKEQKMSNRIDPLKRWSENSFDCKISF